MHGIDANENENKRSIAAQIDVNIQFRANYSNEIISCQEHSRNLKPIGIMLGALYGIIASKENEIRS